MTHLKFPSHPKYFISCDFVVAHTWTMKACLHLTENRQKDNEADKVLLGIQCLAQWWDIIWGLWTKESIWFTIRLYFVPKKKKKKMLFCTVLSVLSTIPGTWPCAISMLLLEVGSGKWSASQDDEAGSSCAVELSVPRGEAKTAAGCGECSGVAGEGRPGFWGMEGPLGRASPHCLWSAAAAEFRSWMHSYWDAVLFFSSPFIFKIKPHQVLEVHAGPCNLKGPHTKL